MPEPGPAFVLKVDTDPGAEIARLPLVDDQGRQLPQIVFLSACLSGALVGVRTWDAMAAALREGAAARRAAEPAAPRLRDRFQVGLEVVEHQEETLAARPTKGNAHRWSWTDTESTAASARERFGSRWRQQW